MSVVEIDKIDFIGFEQESGEVILTISDHLDWDDIQNHLLTLQSKINTYIEFIESEQIHQEYPESIGRKLRVKVVAQHNYPKEGRDFLDQVGGILDTIGVSLSYEIL